MNSDTITVVRSDYASTHPFSPAPLSLSSTTETTFSYANTTGPVIVGIPQQSDIRGATTPLDPNANPAVLSSNLGRPGGYRGPAPFYSTTSFDGRPFQIRACVKATVTTGASAGGATLSIKLYQGTSATVGSDTLLFAPTGINVAASSTGVTLSFYINVDLMWDAGTQKIFGIGSSVCGTSAASTMVITSPAILGTVNGIAATSPAALTFIPSAVFTVNAPTSSTITLQEFGLHQI